MTLNYSITSTSRRIIYLALALSVATLSFPHIVRAENGSTTPVEETTTQEPAPAEQPPEPEPQQPAPEPEPQQPAPEPEAEHQGPSQPTGAASTTYTYNDSTGMWENDQYIWNPATNQTTPKQTPTYSYNPQTGMWDTTEWVFDAPSGTYKPNVISIAVPPQGAELDTSKGSPETTDTDSKQAASAKSAGASSPLLSLLGLAPNGVDSSGAKSEGIFDLFYNAIISNNIDSSAITGDALVAMNTLAGSALSGNASSIATVFNLLQSVWNMGVTGNAFNIFTQNLFGNILGDLWLQPPDPSRSSNPQTSGDIDVNVSSDAAIHNTISLEAASGDAGVTNNTEAGNATTGTATVIANIINAINSSIISGNSLLGMLNIYGNLDGDMLLPQELISTLLASNTLGTLDTSNINNASVLGEFNNTASTTNNVNATASSGSANVTNNTEAGNASSGNADTNITLLNLTGKQVVGKNALLVFVNVMGTWVGVIVNAPAGTTSAALGGGITENSTFDIDAVTDQAIVNDINLTASSGDATVANNTKAGDATSGDAYAAVNILNLNNSQFALSDWFGILFINVFGSWHGSFGVNTAAGTIPSSSNPSTHSTTNVGPQLTANTVRAFRFVPQNDGSYTLEASDDGVATLASADILSPSVPTGSGMAVNQQEEQNKLSQTDWLFTAITLSLGLSLLGTERYFSRRTKQG